MQKRIGFWQNYNLSIVLFILFMVTWSIQMVTGWYEFKAEEQDHQQIATIFGESGYIWYFLQSTMENWQSEFLQLLTFVVLTSFLIHKGSHESKDSDEELKEIVLRIEDRLKKLEKKPAAPK
jgi:hypothetical protein